MAYIGKEPASGIRNRFVYTATAGQTTFSGSDDYSRTLSYTDAEFTDVFLNGVKLDKTDYTATSGTSIVLDEAASVDDILEVLAFDTFSVFSGEFSQDVTVGGTLTANGNVDVTGDTTVTGDLTVDGDIDFASFAKGLTYTLGTTNSDIIRVGFTSGVGDTLTVAPVGASGTSELIFKTAAGSTISERMRIDSSGHLGLGVSSPDGTAHIHSGSAGSVTAWGNADDLVVENNGPAGISVLAPDNQQAQLIFGSASDNIGSIIRYVHDDNELQVGTHISSGFLTFKTAVGAERMRIDSSGNVQVGTTSQLSSEIATFYSSAATGIAIRNPASGPSRTAVLFVNGSTTVGSITTSGVATGYNESSDHRLKENVTAITDGIERLKQLNPSRFNFIVDADTTVDGFLAHEAQTVVPEAVTGTHNEVETWTQDEIDAGDAPANTSAGDNKLDGDGNTIPVYQGIDKSKLVPLLTAALQEAITKIETLETENATQATTIADFETRIAALEAN